MSDSATDITLLLNRAAGGSDSARIDLYLAVEDKLRATARRLMSGERIDHTLQPTVLVDDAFVALTQAEKPVSWQSRRHFYRLAARAMRRVLIDHAKRARADRRGGGQRPSRPEDPEQIPEKKQALDPILLDEALEKLALKNRRLADVVELHHFAGYTLGEVAALLGRSVGTIKNDWAAAKAWLHRELND